jgi:hypothetical protein
MGDVQKDLKGEVPILRDLSGHSFAADRGFNMWTTPTSTCIEKIQVKK